jgi:hypothetical protein
MEHSAQGRIHSLPVSVQNAQPAGELGALAAELIEGLRGVALAHPLVLREGRFGFAIVRVASG